MRYSSIPQKVRRCRKIGRLVGPRRGFTLVELLVVIAIIGMLVALLLPAVSAARARMRQATCMNNLSQIGKAIVTYESSKQRYPGYVEPVKAVGENGIHYLKLEGNNFSNSGFVKADNRSESRVAWSAHILPQIDRQDLWDIIQNSGATQEQRKLKQLSVYVCPDDPELSNTEEAAGLSYVVNTGAWDWEDNGDYHDTSSENGDTKHNGLFHNRVEGNVTTRMSGIADGASTTLMLAENLQKDPTYTWFGVVPGNPGEQQLGMVWVVNPRPGDPLPDNSGCSGPDQQAPFKFEPDGDLKYWPRQPCYARPNSTHPGDRFNVVFADGHGQSMDMGISYIVYQQLLTTHGAKCVDPHAQRGSNPSAAIKAFRNAAPLSESDFE